MVFQGDCPHLHPPHGCERGVVVDAVVFYLWHSYENLSSRVQGGWTSSSLRHSRSSWNLVLGRGTDGKIDEAGHAHPRQPLNRLNLILTQVDGFKVGEANSRNFLDDGC